MDAGEKNIFPHMGKYPVISISLKSMKQYSYDLAYDMLTKAVESEYSRHWKQIEASGALTDAKPGTLSEDPRSERHGERLCGFVKIFV